MGVRTLLTELGSSSLARLVPSWPAVVGTVGHQGTHDRLKQLFGEIGTLGANCRLIIDGQMLLDIRLLLLQLFLEFL